MWSAAKPMRPLPMLRLTEAQQQIQTCIHEHDGWIARLCGKYGLPRAVLLRMLDRPGALEDEIALVIVERATDHAHMLFADELDAPAGDDLYTRAVRGVLSMLLARKEAQAAQAQAARYAETDDVLRRMKAGEEL